MVTPKSVAMVAAFLMEGVRDGADYEAMLASWDGGCYELVDELVSYAEPIDNMADVGREHVGDFPGVFDYEVTSLFGQWFAQQVLVRGDVPPEQECHDRLVELGHEFFLQGTDKREDEGLKHVLMLALKGVLRG